MVPPVVLAVEEDGDEEEAEEGYEKLALFVNAQGKPTHAARSLPNLAWTSKLGNGEDIQHPTAESVGGRTYGSIALFMKRPVAKQLGAI